MELVHLSYKVVGVDDRTNVAWHQLQYQMHTQTYSRINFTSNLSDKFSVNLPNMTTSVLTEVFCMKLGLHRCTNM